MTTRSAVVRLHGTTRAALAASWEQSVSLTAGDVVGASGSVQWSPGEGVIPGSAVPHPLRPGWDRGQGSPCSLDIVTNGWTHRVFTGMVESGGGSLTGELGSSLTDFIGRLDSPASVPPVAFTMPARPNVTEADAQLRRVGLWGTWVTQMVMAQAGFNTSQSVQASSIWYQSMAGSSWVAPNPDHTVDTLGHITTAHRADDPTTAPQVMQGTHVPCMQNVYVLGSTLPRRRSSSTSWQLTVDMASDQPTTSHTGRVDIRTLPQSAGAGVRLDWTQTVMRAYRRDTDGTLTLLAQAARASGGVYSMRWSVVVRQDGTLTLHANDRLSVASASSHGIQLPSDASAATVRVESEGPVGAVQVTRSEATSIVTQSTSARIFRSTFSNRSLPAFDYRERQPAINILTEQANAERSLLGMPIWMWIDHNGHLINADPAYLATQQSAWVLTNLHGTGPVQDLSWRRDAAGPYSYIDVVAKFGTARVRRIPTLLLKDGRQQNYSNGDTIDEILHPEQDQTWIQPDYMPYFAGQSTGGNQEFNRGIGTWVGGTRVNASDGEPAGWITPGMIDGWTQDAGGRVLGAIEVIDHRTVLLKGTVAVGGSYAMSSMPSQASAGLWAHRAMQPLPQLRGFGRIDWTERVERVQVSGSMADPVLTHDCRDWCPSGTWRGQIGEALAQAATNPVTEVTLRTGLNPGVRVGDKVTARIDYPDAARLTVVGLVAGVAGQLPGEGMTVRLVVLSHEWIDAPAAGGGTTSGDYSLTPPPRDRVEPPIVLPPGDAL